MEHSYWHSRWENNETGFHMDQSHPLLERYWSNMQLPEGSQVFVPLCGKSQDLIWLRQQGFQVLGNELSPIAVQDFYTEHGVKASPVALTSQEREALVGNQTLGEMVHWQGGQVDILQGDFFAMTPSMLSGVAAVYDRAALVALPPKMRQAYAEHLQAILPANAAILLITLEYPQDEKQGPPFSVSEEMVHALYRERFNIKQLHREDIGATQRSPRSQHLSYMHECVYQLTPR